jgi:polyphosphate kinase 2 (PPK2 family)
MKLGEVDLTKRITKGQYKAEVERQNLELEILKCQLKLRDKNKKAVIAFEGWDAAGKGGAIKRLTEPMDPRRFKVYQTSAPNEVEKAKHYLWRFWINLPSSGEMVVFDRTWYGRVLVERIEGFCTEDEWKRAYDEINQFEKTVVQDNTKLIKFFVHISREEQKKRFEEREENPLKKYKIGKDDYRNRKRWDDYLKAYDDMFARTDNPFAPWKIIAGDDKEYARLKIMETFVSEMKDFLKN